MKSRLRILIAIALLCGGCSFQSYVLVINPHGESRRILLHLESPQTGNGIFNTRDFAFYQFKNNEVDFSSHVPLSLPKAATHELEIPARSALRIAVLRNETFASSEQKFINGRVFNLKSLVSGEIAVTKSTFSDYFKRTPFGAAWHLP